MKKHLLLLFVLALLAPWATKAQTLESYGFTTGIDASKWVDMTGATQILTPSGSDGLASSLQTIGFSFPFAGTNYTQYSVNTDGNLRLGSTVTGTGNYATPFSTSYASQNNPKINAFGCDGYGVSGTHYVKAKQHVTTDGDTLLAVEFCMGTYSSSTRSELYKWQIHLYTNGNIDIVFPSASALPSTAPAVVHQCGLCVSASDGWIISAASNTAEHFTNGTSVTNPAGTWFDANRYYSFIHPSNISCPAPTGITASNITATSATISWTAGGTESQWELTIGEDTYYATDTTYTLTNLDGNTPYVVSVRSICGSGDTSFASSGSFRTSCVPISSLPYENDFEDEPYYLSGTTSYAEAFPNCWTRINDATGTTNYYPYINTSTTYLIHGGKSMYWYHSTSTTYADNEYAVLPPVDLDVYDMSDLTLSFYAKTTATAAPWPLFIVGVMTNPTNATTFVPVDTITLTTTATLYAVSLANYTGTGNYIAIRCPRTTAARYCSLDDIYLTDAWCDIPENVTATATTETVTISWQGTAGIYEVVLGNDTISYVTDTFYTFTGLPANTPYNYSVASICSSSNSMYVGGSVRTACAPLTSSDLPYYEDFEAYGTGSASPIDPCWNKGVVAITGSGTTTNFPYPYSSAAINGVRGLYFYAATTTSTSYYNWMVLPPIGDDLTMSDLMVTFNLKRTATTSHTTRLVVGVTTDFHSTAGFTPIDTLDFSAAAVSSIHEVEVSFENYTDTGRYVLFYAPAPASATTYNAFYIDDIALREIPTCYWPTDVSVQSVSVDEATISWTPDARTSNPSSWAIEYGPHGFTRGNGDMMSVYDTTVTLTSLLPSTEYDIYVSADCGGDVSDPTMISFRTLCVALDSLPYFENFEGVTGNTSTTPASNNLPPCWNYFNNGTRANYQYCPYVYNSSTYAHSGSNCVRFYSYNATTAGDSNQYLILPMVDSNLYSISNLRLTFWHRAYSTSTSYHADVIVGVMSNPGNESTFVPYATFTSSSTTYTLQQCNFGSYTGNHGCIALKFPRPASSSNYEYGYIDDITLEEMPSCPNVASHQVTATAGAAHITWDIEAGFSTSPDSYEVSYGFASGTPTTVTTTDHELTLTGLSADSTYNVSISSVCDGTPGTPHTFAFSTQSLSCLEWDTTGVGGNSSPAATYVVGTPGTSTTNVMPVNGAYNYSYCNHLILRSDISTVPSGTTYISGIDFQYAGASPMTSKTNCAIYMCHTTMTLCDNFANPADLVLVYEGPLNCATPNDWNHFEFNRGTFAYNGTSNIIVAIVDNSGATDANESFYYENIGTSRSHRVYRDDAPYTFADLGTVTAGNSVWRTNMRLTTGGNGGGTCLTQASCATPALTVEMDTTGDIALSWLPGYQETSWDIDYRAADTTGWTNVLSGTSLTNHTIPLSSLQSNTQYIFRVTANCSDTNIAATASFTTPCSFVSIPYIYGFEDLATGSSSTRPNIPCWHHLNNGTSYPGYPYVSSTTPHTGVRNLYWYGSTTTGTYGDYQVVVLPPVDITINPINTLQLTFWARPTSTSYAPVFLVGVMTDPTDITTFETVTTINLDHTTTNWMPYEALLSSYTGTGRYVAVRANRPSSTWYAYTDDFALENAPNCARVSNINVSNITMNGATVSWDTTSTTDYEVQYGPSGFTLGAGTTLAVSYVDSVDITGLMANTPYDVYVRGICTPDTGNWSFVTSFRTSCGMIDVLPFFEDFENQATTSSTTGTPFIPCWALLNNGTSYGNYPYLSASTTYNHTTGGGKGLYWYGSTTATTYSDYMYLILPQIDTVELPINTLQLSFWAKASSASYNPVFEVGVLTSTTDTTFESLNTIAINGSTEWTEYVTSLSAHQGAGSYVAIRALRPSSTWYAYVDDITLDAIPACPRVEDLHVTNTDLDTIAIAWTDTSSNLSWNVEYDTVAFAPGTGHMTAIHVTDTFCVLSGLDSGTVYHIYVYPDCGTDVSERHITAATLAASPATVPYSCDFEAAGVNGWDLLNGSQHNFWMVGNATGNPGRSLYVTNDGSSNSYDGAASYVFATRTFHFTDAGEYAYSFDWKCNGESSFDFIRAALVPAGTTLTPGEYSGFDNTSAVPAGGIALDGSNRLNLQTSWQTQIGTFNITTPGNYTMVFLWRNDGSVYNVPPAAIDNISLVQNTCSMPQNVTAAVTGDSISLTWTPGDSESAWELTLGSTTVVATTTAYTFTGLTPNTNYTFSIRSICGVGDTSLAYTETYHTPCGAVSVPYTENFDTYTTSTTAATGVSVPCWDAILTGTATYQTGNYVPQIYYSSTYAHSGSYSYRLYGQGYHMLPPMSVPLDSLQLTFWDYTTSTSYGLEVGVMEGNTFVPIETINTPNSTHMQHTVYFGTYTGTSRIIAFRNYYTTSATTYYSYHYLDNVEVDYLPTCPPVVGIHAVSASTSSINVDWTDQTTAAQWQVRYGPTSTSTTTLTVNSHPVTLTGLDTLTSYVVSVRPICSATDTGEWSQFVSLATELCDNAVAATTGNPTGTSYYTPVNNYYNYTLSETIIDSAELAGIGDISAIAYSYAYTTASTSKPNVTIWLQPTNKTVFSSSSDIVLLDTTVAVQVYQGNLNCSQGWNYFQLDTTYIWDGHSNLLVIVDDNSGDYDGSAYTFNTSNCTGYKTLVWYSDSYNADPTSSTYSGTKAYYQYRATMKLVSCGASCYAPVIDNLVPAETAVTLNWHGSASSYEVAAVPGNWAEPSAPTTVTGSSYTFTGLASGTLYSVGIRAVCGEGFYSEWVVNTVNTIEHPCYAPTNVTATNVTFGGADIAWTPGEASQTNFQIRYSTGGDTTIVDVTANPYTFSGLANSTEYSVAVRAVCGVSDYSDWSAPATFTTATCQPVTGVTVSNITATTATVNWTGSASGYQVEYGYEGFTQGAGTRVDVTGNSYTITGLSSETSYDVYVRAVCGENNYSGWSAARNFETGAGSGTSYTVTVTVNDPSMGSVTGAGTYEEGTNVTLRATSNPGYHFVNWNDGVTDSVRTFVITSNMSFTANFAQNVGIDDVEGNAISLYPNPASSTVTLTGIEGAATVTVVDMNGREIQAIKHSGNQAMTINVSDLSQGAYFVRITGEKVNAIRKLIVR